MSSLLIAIMIPSFIVVMLWISFAAYRNAVLSEHRQHLFRLRQSWFKYAENGKVDFSSNLYQDVRATINAHIRFAEQISISHFIYMSALYKKHQDEFDLLAKQRDYFRRKQATETQIQDAEQLLKQVARRSAYYIVRKNIVIYSLLRIFEMLRPSSQEGYEKKKQETGTIITAVARQQFC